LGFLRDEIVRVGESNKALRDLIRSVEERVRSELEDLTAEDAKAFARLLGIDDAAKRVDEVRALIAARDLYGKRRLWSTVQVVKAETTDSADCEHSDVLALASAIELELRPSLTTVGE
jgi:hypothetical protein